MSAITTHVLDTSRGRPAAGVAVLLTRVTSEKGSIILGSGATDADGRLRDLLPAGQAIEPGTYRLVFATADYFGDLGVETFYPRVTIEFEIRDAAQHHHVPLLISPFGYSTYRGS